MVLEESQIKQIMTSLPIIKNFMDFLSIQEVERMVGILHDVFSSPQQVNVKPELDQDSWLKSTKNQIIKKLYDSQELFGFRDLPHRFPIEDFLTAYYQANSVKQ